MEEPTPFDAEDDEMDKEDGPGMTGCERTQRGEGRTEGTIQGENKAHREYRKETGRNRRNERERNKKQRMERRG